MCVGDMIKREREKRRWSQERLGHEVGVSRAAVSLWEKGSGIRQENVIRLAQVFGLTEEEKREWLTLLVESGLILLDTLPSGRHAPLMGWNDLHQLVSPDVSLEDLPRIQGDPGLPQDAIAASVSDDSMEPDVHTRDLIIFAHSVRPRLNDLVVVQVKDEVLLRRYIPRGTDKSGQFVFDLLASNPNYPTITSNSFLPATILGTVIERRLLRQA